MTRSSRALGSCRFGTSSTASGRSGAAGPRENRSFSPSCYRRAIELAAEAGDARVAFPAISTGAFGYPLEEGAEVALSATRTALKEHPDVVEARFWLFEDDVRRAFEAAL